MTKPIRLTLLSFLLFSLTSFSQEKYEADKVAKWSIVDALKEFYGALIDLKQIVGVEFYNKTK